MRISNGSAHDEPADRMKQSIGRMKEFANSWHTKQSCPSPTTLDQCPGWGTWASHCSHAISRAWPSWVWKAMTACIDRKTTKSSRERWHRILSREYISAAKIQLFHIKRPPTTDFPARRHCSKKKSNFAAYLTVMEVRLFGREEKMDLRQKGDGRNLKFRKPVQGALSCFSLA